MKTKVLTIVFTLCVLMANAQEQSGLVKTIGRPGQPGIPLEGVLVRVQGEANASLSDSNGAFSLVLSNYHIGQAYKLSRVSRNGYQLADGDVIGRQYPYSDEIPLEISMVSYDEYNKTKFEIENAVRSRVEAEFDIRLAELKQQLEDKTISEEAHIRKLCELNDYYDNIENLISKLADRYARTDYDRLDSIDVQINSLIEQGKLDEAERLIQSKGTKKALAKIIENNIRLARTLEEGKRAEAEMRQEYAYELIMQFDIAALRFDNVAAAAHLKERMELDTKNIEWKMEYASFIRDYLGKYDEALVIFQGVLKTTDNIEIIADLHGNIGNIYQIKGQYDKALEAYCSGSEIRECDSLLRKDLATSYLNIGSIYLSMEKYAEAESYLEKSRDLFAEYDDTLGMAGVYNKLAVKYADDGDFENAELMLMKSLDLRQKIFNDNNLQVASEYLNYSILMRRLGRFQESMDYAEKALQIRSKILGESHPGTASVYEIIGMTKIKTGDFSSVLPFYEKALESYLQFYGEIHPDIATVYNNIADYYDSVLNDFQQAKDYYTKALVIYEKIYGHTHSAVATCMNDLASLYNSIAEYDKALELYDEASEILESIYGSTHISMGDAFNNVAAVYLKLGRYQDAKSYLEKALSIYVQHYGQEHEAIGLIYNNLGRVCAEMEEDQNALDYFGKSCAVYRKLYGDSYYGLATPYDNIGAIYYEYKMYDEAEKFMLEALNIRKLSYGSDHSATAISYNNLSLLYLDMSKYSDAEVMLENALKIQKSLYGENHPDVATTMSNLSTLYRRQGRYDQALNYLKSAVEIVIGCFSKEHERVVLYKYALADLYYNMRQYDKAIELFEETMNTSIEDRGSEIDVASFIGLHKTYKSIMEDEDYSGSYDDTFTELNRNTVFYATVADGYQAAQMGLSGEYDIVAYEEWTIADKSENFLVFNSEVASRPKKTYVFHRDGEFVPITFEGSLGVWINPKWVPAEEKALLVKNFKKWHKKRR